MLSFTLSKRTNHLAVFFLAAAWLVSVIMVTNQSLYSRILFMNFKGAFFWGFYFFWILKKKVDLGGFRSQSPKQLIFLKNKKTLGKLMWKQFLCKVCEICASCRAGYLWLYSLTTVRSVVLAITLRLYSLLSAVTQSKACFLNWNKIDAIQHLNATWQLWLYEGFCD